MSASINGVIVSAEVARWRPGAGVAEAVRERLRAEIGANMLTPSDEREFLEACESALRWVCQRGEHPGRSWEGAHVTWTLLPVAGEPVHANVFNPIGWAGVQALHDELVGAGSPVGLLDNVPLGGPWELSDGDALFFGGWDEATLQAVSDAISGLGGQLSGPLWALGDWVTKALKAERTLWAWIV